MIKAGAFDQRIVIETPVVTTNELGEQTTTWIFDQEVWAKVVEVPGREFLKGDYQAEEKAVFQIRYREMDSLSRVTWNDRTYRVNSVTGTMRDGTTWLHCIAQSEAN